MRLSRIATLTATLAIAGCAILGAQTRTLVTYTTGSGSASEADRGQAIDEATQTAQNWANSSCMGMVTAVDTTFSNCSKIGSDDDGNVTYMCTVNVKARCEIQYRGRSIDLK
jgi:hypothetical protein